MPEEKDKEVQVVNIRLVKEPSLYSTEAINTPDDVLKVVAKELSQYDREVFAILNLKSNGQVINLNICSVGTLSSAMVSPREVFKSSILSNAAAIIAIHNHPSGSPTASEEDKTTTRRLQECGALMDIKLLDHIIVAGENGEMFSFRGAGMLDEQEKIRKDWER
jgi:DNA repair protein RadC